MEQVGVHDLPGDHGVVPQRQGDVGKRVNLEQVVGPAVDRAADGLQHLVVADRVRLHDPSSGRNAPSTAGAQDSLEAAMVG